MLMEKKERRRIECIRCILGALFLCVSLIVVKMCTFFDRHPIKGKLVDKTFLHINKKREQRMIAETINED